MTRLDEFAINAMDSNSQRSISNPFQMLMFTTKVAHFKNILHHHSKMLPKQIVWMLTFFDIFAYNTGSSKLSNTRLISILIYVLHILLIIFVSLYQLQFEALILSNYEFLEIFNQILQYLAALFTYLLTIVDSFVHRRAHKRFWNLVQRIDQHFYHQSRFTFRCYGWKFIEFFSIMSLATYLISTVSNNTFFLLICVYDIIGEIRVFYYLFCLEILHFQLKMIETELKIIQNTLNQTNADYSNLTQFSESSNRVSFEFELQRLKWIRGYFHCAYEMVNLLNEIFGWSNVQAISFLFYLLLTDFNWMYMNFNVCTAIQFISK